jgi:hypothetical protein
MVPLEKEEPRWRDDGTDYHSSKSRARSAKMKDIPKDKLYMDVTGIPEANLGICPEDTHNQPRGT